MGLENNRGVQTGDFMKGERLGKRTKGALAGGRWIKLNGVFRGGGEGHMEAWDEKKWTEIETLFGREKKEEITCFRQEILS